MSLDSTQPARPAPSARPDDAILEIVREVLEEPAVGLDDDLFDLGFDSLVIAMTAARVRQRLGIELPLSVYFDAGTVAELAQAVADGTARTAGSEGTPA